MSAKDAAAQRAAHYNLGLSTLKKIEKRFYLVDTETKSEIKILLDHLEIAIKGLYKNEVPIRSGEEYDPLDCNLDDGC